MSRFKNEYLAESVGYSTGHANGLADGIQAGKSRGYTEGWNAATIHANKVIALRDQEIARLTGEVHKGNASIAEWRAALEKSHRVSELYHTERDELNQLYHQEKAKRERLQYLVNLAREKGVNVEDFDR